MDLLIYSGLKTLTRLLYVKPSQHLVLYSYGIPKKNIKTHRYLHNILIYGMFDMNVHNIQAYISKV